MLDFFSSMTMTLGGGSSYGDWWNPVISIVSVVVGIVGYIFLYKYLKLHTANSQTYTKQWCLEGVVLHRVTLLVLIKNALVHILGVLYMISTIFVVLNSFGAFGMVGYLGAGKAIAGFFAQLIIFPIIVRLFYEIIYLIVFKLGKYIVKFVIGLAKCICKIVVFVWDAIKAAGTFISWFFISFVWSAFKEFFNLPVQFCKWLSALLEKQIVRRDLETENLKKNQNE